LMLLHVKWIVKRHYEGLWKRPFGILMGSWSVGWGAHSGKKDVMPRTRLC
jgi:hypothetical protein